MNKEIILNQKNEVGQNAISSLEVAEMVEKEHSKLLKDIRRYILQIGQANLSLSSELKIAPGDFFIESTYINSQNKKQPCYNVTKKGCEFIAHKLTGVKGAAFTARYINRFHDMEQELQQLKQPELTEKERFLLKNSKTWFQRNNWKMKMICKEMDWSRKYLYHRILSELSEFYNLPVIENMYIKKNGHKPQYKMDLLDYFPQLQETAERYVDFLLSEIDDEQEIPFAPL